MKKRRQKQKNDNLYSHNVSYRVEEFDIEETEAESFEMNM